MSHDFQVEAGGSFWTMQVAGDRLYAAGRHGLDAVGVAIWSLSALSGPSTSVKVTFGDAQTHFVSHLVVRDDVLAVAARDKNTIFVYKNASKITADRPADFAITHPSMVRPSHLAIDASGRLYAVDDDDGVLVFRDVGTAPALVTELKTPPRPRRADRRPQAKLRSRSPIWRSRALRRRHGDLDAA